ncbi:Golgin candidate 5 [Capsicum annuum]|uniref:Golgin candidate 5 n=1 Tax=Capsicum annuum TaxID=4072 RepID=A0A2G2ZBS9_CAPAN|nr:Golgin candidate 5 [Capsicum annuum]
MPLRYLQETNARKAEAWAAVERSLNSRLQEAEAKAATSEERNDLLMNACLKSMFLRLSCLRAEQTRLTKSLDRERHRAAENRQEYLALKEEAETNEGRVNQLEEEIKELRRKHKQELQEAITHQELLRQKSVPVHPDGEGREILCRINACLSLSSTNVSQELEREKAARLDQERESRSLTRRLSSASSLSSMEESYFLQASLDSSDNLSERRNALEGNMSPYFMKSMTPALRQKEGELASYMSRLASMEAIRDSLAEDLVKMTAELEELRADIIDMKEMYREQIQVLSSSMSTT